MELLGNKIQILRKNKNLTQQELVEKLSVSSQAVSKWERNLSAPDISMLPVIARFFGITMDELFNYRLDALTYKECTDIVLGIIFYDTWNGELPQVLTSDSLSALIGSLING